MQPRLSAFDMTSLSKLPVVPVRKVGQLAENDSCIFTEDRAMGLAWGQLYDHYRRVGEVGKATYF